MPTKRFDKKHWKMVVVLLATCRALLFSRWAERLRGLPGTNPTTHTA
ncbi:hypothetical protein KCA24_30010 [Escherichia coli]|nr:hypothetical protein [Escherichia coli]